MDSIIEIGMGNTNDGKLDLSDEGKTLAKKGKYVIWQINSYSNVASFKIKIISNPHKIFSKPPYPEGYYWKAKIKRNAKNGAECKYSILWLDEHGFPYEHDPKIAVDPSKSGSIYWIIGLLLVVLGLFSQKKHLLKKIKN